MDSNFWACCNWRSRSRNFGDVFDDTFDDVGRAGQGKIAEMETDGKQATVFSTPLGFRVVNQTMFAAGGEERGKFLKIPKDIRDEIERLELLKTGTSQNLQKEAGFADRNEPSKAARKIP